MTCPLIPVKLHGFSVADLVCTENVPVTFETVRQRVMNKKTAAPCAGKNFKPLDQRNTSNDFVIG